MPARNRSSRPYSAAHRKARARLLPAAYGTLCPCCLGYPTAHHCDGIMTNPARMDCDHTLALAIGGVGTGDRIICSPCNRSAGATLGNQLRGATHASRDW